MTAERLAAAARAQTGLPGATVTNPRPVWDHRVDGIWGVTVDSDERRANAFLRVCGDRVAVPAGMDQAARELREMRVLEGGSWDGGLIYVVTAAGGATPGFPDVWTTDEEPLDDGGARVTVHMSQEWVAYAAAGGAGPLPSRAYLEGGETAPVPMGTATLEIAGDYGLRWRYQLPGGDVEGPQGVPAPEPPVLSDDALVALLDAAREKAGAPRAMFAREPSAGVADLWGIGPVEV